MSGAVQTIGPVTFDWIWWSTRYPELSEWCSPGQAQGYFDIATLYCENTANGMATLAMCELAIAIGLCGYPSAGVLLSNIPKRQMLLGLLTAHVAALNAPIGGNQPSGLVGRISNASEGSISVAVAYPEVAGAEWYNTTRYGAMFWTATKQYRIGQYFPGPGAIGERFRRWVY